MDRPPGATHVHKCYGNTVYYKCAEYARYNQVSDEWQQCVSWHYWDRGAWVPESAGFCSRKLSIIDLED